MDNITQCSRCGNDRVGADGFEPLAKVLDRLLNLAYTGGAHMREFSQFNQPGQTRVA